MSMTKMELEEKINHLLRENSILSKHNKLLEFKLSQFQEKTPYTSTIPIQSTARSANGSKLNSHFNEGRTPFLEARRAAIGAADLCVIKQRLETELDAIKKSSEGYKSRAYLALFLLPHTPPPSVVLPPLLIRQLAVTGVGCIPGM
ncbi:hypothetical protein SprV_0100180400 [Sparganum proliferum]